MTYSRPFMIPEGEVLMEAPSPKLEATQVSVPTLVLSYIKEWPQERYWWGKWQFWTWASERWMDANTFPSVSPVRWVPESQTCISAWILQTSHSGHIEKQDSISPSEVTSFLAWWSQLLVPATLSLWNQTCQFLLLTISWIQPTLFSQSPIPSQGRLQKLPN